MTDHFATPVTSSLKFLRSAWRENPFAVIAAGVVVSVLVLYCVLSVLNRESGRVPSVSPQPVGQRNGKSDTARVELETANGERRASGRWTIATFYHQRISGREKNAL